MSTKTGSLLWDLVLQNFYSTGRASERVDNSRNIRKCMHRRSPAGDNSRISRIQTGDSIAFSQKQTYICDL